MRSQRKRSLRKSGVSLVETMVAIGVLALVIPLALAAMLKAGEVGNSARAETRAPAMAEFCLMELEAARVGNSAYFKEIKAGTDFPAAGQVLGLAFGREGQALGVISKAEYDKGMKELGTEKVYYLATLLGRVEAGTDSEMMTVTVAIEYPAVLKAERRSKVSFHTKLP